MRCGTLIKAAWARTSLNHSKILISAHHSANAELKLNVCPLDLSFSNFYIDLRPFCAFTHVYKLTGKHSVPTTLNSV